MKTAMQELIDKIQYSIDKQSGLSITKEQENTLEAIKLVAESLLEKEKEQIVQAFKTGYNVTEYDADDYFDLLYNQNK